MASKRSKDPETLSEIPQLPEADTIRAIALSALLDAARNPSTPITARVQAAKALVEHLNSDKDPDRGRKAPGGMTRAEIEAELAQLSGESVISKG